MPPLSVKSTVPNVLLEWLSRCGPCVENVNSALYLEVAGFDDLEHMYGTEMDSFLEKACQRTLKTESLEESTAESGIQVFRLWSHNFVILITSAPNPETVFSQDIHQTVLQVERRLNQSLRARGLPIVHIHYGLGRSTEVPSENNKILFVYRLIAEAIRSVHRPSEKISTRLFHEFHNIIERREIRTAFQPICHLESLDTYGWEALTRGPEASRLHSPAALFDIAERAGHLLDLERLCRDIAIRSAQLDSHHLLFLNISPKILANSDFRPGETKLVLNKVGLTPRQVVIEITENHAIQEYESFLHLVSHYKEQGYQIAIDDVGAGHSGLVTLMEVKPDFVKVDMSLIRDIHKNSTKQDIVRAINRISLGFGGTVIAEGIETAEEFETVNTCGVTLGQGFFLGKPQIFSNPSDIQQPDKAAVLKLQA